MTGITRAIKVIHREACDDDEEEALINEVTVLKALVIIN